MKYYFSLFVFIIFTASAFSQIDSRNNSISIPAIESPKDSIENSAITPQKPINTSDNDFKSLNTPKVSTNLNLPKKEFSMFPKEKFGNEDIKLSPEEIEQRNGSLTDQFLGDFKSKAKFVNVVYRDHGYVDGDIIQVLVNDDVIHARVFLSGGFKGFKLDLQPGFNKIDFLALNQGSSGPNTAEFRVVDDAGNLVSANQWNLAKGVKATIIVMKE